jgi:hypothetical protein
MQRLSPIISPRINIATLLFVVCCLLSAGRILTDAPIRLHEDDVAERSDQRFTSLKAALPPQGVVGYIGETGDPSDYYLAQYALAPLVVDHSPNHPLVVGNFPLSGRLGTPPNNLQLVSDFGRGVLLFANKDAK